MRSPFRALIVAATVLLVGMGCQIRPRVVQVPDAPAIAPDVSSIQIASAPILAVVQKVGSDAHVTRGGERLPLPPGTVLLPGDEIETGSSTLMMLFPETGISKIDPGTRVILIGEVASASSSGIFAELNLLQGAIWTRFERLLGPSEWFSVEANGVVATVRGTGFGVLAKEDGSTDIHVADHQVELSLKEGLASPQEIRAVPTMNLVAGEGWRGYMQEDISTEEQWRYRVRTLDAQERTHPGFVFCSTEIPESSLHLPSILRRLPGTASMTEAEAARTSVLKRIREEAIRRRGFKAPTRSILPNEQAPTGTRILPIIEGPTE